MPILSPPSAKPALRGVPRTSLLTLRARAEEQSRTEPLLVDPLAEEWMEQVGWDPILDRWYEWQMQVGINIRCRFFDEATQAFLAEHPQATVVEIGCGLSTRYYRLGQPKSNWIEMDLPEILQVRQDLESETPWHTWLEGSVLDFDWPDRLPEFEPEQTLLIAEGLLMYFPTERVHQIIRHWRQRFAGAMLLLDIFNWFGQWVNGLQARSIGAPLQWTINHLDQLAALGLMPLDSRCMFAEHANRWRYLAPFNRVETFLNSDRFVKVRIEPWD